MGKNKDKGAYPLRMRPIIFPGKPDGFLRILLSRETLRIDTGIKIFIIIINL